MTGAEREKKETEGREKSAETEWNPAAAAKQRPAAPGRVTAADVPSEESLLIGSPGSGKTSFLAALARAGMLTVDTFSTCLPLGHATWLLRDACSSLRRCGPLVSPPRHGGSYSFELRGRTNPDLQAATEGPRRLVVHELSGAALFPVVGESSEVNPYANVSTGFVSERARNADHLVLCLDVLDPRPEDWQLVLIRLFDDLASGGSETSRGHRALRFDRVLVLFSRLDLLCQRAWEALFPPGRNGRGFVALGSALGRARPLDLAERLDPIGQAIELVGEETLAQILSYIGPRAQLGMGFVSAGGFDLRTGFPFLDATGRPTAASVLREWRPHGVLEALDFLAWGRSSATVRLIDRRVLAEYRTVDWVDAHLNHHLRRPAQWEAAETTS